MKKFNKVYKYAIFSIVFLILIFVQNKVFAVEDSESRLGYRIENNEVVITSEGHCNSDLIIPSEIEGKKVTKIANSAFFSSNIESVVVPNTVKIIEDGAFQSCKSLKTVTLPNELQSLGGGAFMSCEKLENISLGNNITVINNLTFAGCLNLKNITIPYSVTTINNNCFGACSSLTEIVIPNNVTKIGKQAFASCINLKKITIPRSVTSMEKDTFTGIPLLTIYCYSDSYAKNYAQIFNIDYKLLDSTPTDKEEQQKPSTDGENESQQKPSTDEKNESQQKPNEDQEQKPSNKPIQDKNPTINNNNSTSEKNDNTIASGSLPKAGVQYGIVAIIFFIVIISIIFYSKYKNFKDIK